MEIEIIDVFSLADTSELSPIRCADLSEAASVCLDRHHEKGQKITIEGDLTGDFELLWKEVTQQIRDSRNDMDYAVESGAYCLAILVIERLTNYKVVKQSQKRTGFDYWMGRENEEGLQEQARLEVSGILKGSKGMVNKRMIEKIRQTQKSDNMNIPAYIVVVEFSKPMIKIRKR
ncbi:MAG: hypothetical protein AAF849_05915 [Bacteroidota bacterium]